MGKVSGANSTVLTFGGAFGVALVTAVLAAHGQPATPAALAGDLQPALLLAAGLASLGAVAALGVGSRRRVRTPRPATPVLEAQGAGR